MRTRSGASTASAPTFEEEAAQSWEFWWEHNQDALLAASPPSRQRTATATAGHLVGRGRRSDAQEDVSALVRSEIAPLLQDILRSEDDAELCDSATLALARVSPADLASFVRGDIQRGLQHPALSVRTSAVLALGVLGDAGALPLLHGLMLDSPSGRQALGSDRVPWQVRAYAALALGLVNDARAVGPMLDAVRSSPASDRELRVAAVVGLGLTDNAAWSEARDGLEAIVHDVDEDSVVRAHAASALAKLGDPSVLPRLLQVLAEGESPDVVRQGVVIAIGMLGDPSQPPVVQALERTATRERDASSRHLALLALARVAAKDTNVDVDDVRRDVERMLREGIDDPPQRTDRSWAALATGLYLREREPITPTLREALLSRYVKESDPSVRGAFAIGIGLAGLRERAPALIDDMLASGDDAFRGHAAMALGMLDHSQAAPALLELSTSPRTSDRLRHQAVRALGVLGDSEVTVALLAALQEAESIDVAWSLSRALGRDRDPRSIGLLVRLAEDPDRRVVARAFACVALGLVADKAALRFNTPIQSDLVYLAPATVVEEVIGL